MFDLVTEGERRTPARNPIKPSSRQEVALQSRQLFGNRIEPLEIVEEPAVDIHFLQLFLNLGNIQSAPDPSSN